MSYFGTNQNRDLLDVLRELNATNINDDPQKRDDFFASLYSPYEEPILNKINPTLHSFITLKETNKYKYDDPEKHYDYLIEQIGAFLCKEARIYDRICQLVINEGNATYKEISYAAEIESMREFIEINYPNFFSRFKVDFLKYIIFNYCRNFCNFYQGKLPYSTGFFETNEYIARLNKMIAIYAEERGILEFGDEIPYVISVDFLSLISRKFSYSADELLDVINKMIANNDKLFKPISGTMYK